jgi:hypothetical protein
MWPLQASELLLLLLLTWSREACPETEQMKERVHPAALPRLINRERESERERARERERERERGREWEETHTDTHFHSLSLARESSSSCDWS